MPFVRISVQSSTPAATRKLIADSVYEAMRETIGIPEGDRFIVVTAHEANDMFIDPSFMGANRSNQLVLTQIFLSRGRTVEQKQALYQSIATRLNQAAGITLDDVMIVLNENSFEDWSFCKGQAQFVLNPPSWVSAKAEGD
jgi:4-oxalocrotonate tautomerase